MVSSTEGEDARRASYKPLSDAWRGLSGCRRAWQISPKYVCGQ
jgi:hypothetical protein